MKGKKALFLFLSLILPICVFLFLKKFGKNEFVVESLYQSVAPEPIGSCGVPSIPYRVQDSIIHEINFGSDSLTLIWFVDKAEDIEKPKNKVTEKYKALNQQVLAMQINKNWKQCVFFMRDQYDILLLNRNGLIRGEYSSFSRDEMDRLFIELDIILKRY